MPNRGLWKFSYTADTLLGAATTKKTWHEGRLQWWTNKQVELKDKIRSEGIEIDESVAFRGGSMSNDYNAVRGASVTIRNDLLKDLTECSNKVAEHKGKIKDYAAWEQVLTSQGQATFDLFQDDWLFFFGK